MREVTQEKIDKYFDYTEKALKIAQEASKKDEEKAEIILDMARRYLSDAKHFVEKQEVVTAFAALNYAHGWLDCGARLKIYEVNDDNLFTVDK